MCSLVWRGRLREAPDLWIHQRGNLQLYMCSRLLWWQVWRYCTLTLAAGRWAGREQTGVFKEELCYPTGIWSSALEEAAVMMDYCNYQNWHSLAQFTTGTSRLMLRLMVLWHILLVYQQEEVLCLDLKRPLYESKLVFGIQVISSDRAVEICMLPHCYLLLWKLAIAPHYSFKHSCCLHNHGAIRTQNM